MFRKAYQKGFLTVLYAGGSSPLKIWDRVVTYLTTFIVVNGHVKRVTDEDVRTLVLEMRGTNVATCFIFTPINPRESLGVSLPFLVLIIKNLKKYFSFEIQVLDDRNMRRRFRVSNYQTTTKVRPFGTTMPIGLNPGWNQIQFNLADFTKRAYGSCYVETQKIQVHANCRIRRIYFCERLYPDNELPNEYKLFYPCVEEKKKKETVQKDVRAEVPPPSEVGDEPEVEEMVMPEEFAEPDLEQALELPEGGVIIDEVPQPEEPDVGTEEITEEVPDETPEVPEPVQEEAPEPEPAPAGEEAEEARSQAPEEEAEEPAAD